MRRLLKFIAFTLIAAVCVGAYLVKFHGLRIERAGNGIRPIVSFYQAEQHLAAIEQNRAPDPDPAPPAEPKAVPSVPEVQPQKPVAKPYWTDFRGPHRDGVYDEMPITTKWPSEGPERLWRKPVGGGYASFVVANGSAFTIEQRRDQEVLAAYDMASGRQIWANAWNASFQESMGGDGPRATPTWHDGRIYSLGAEGEFRCIEDKNGRTVWSRNILRDSGAPNLQWGMAASPLVVDNAVIVVPGGPDGKSVMAYDKTTGEPLWHALNDKAAYTAPMLVDLAGQRQILVVTATRAAGLTKTGKLLWEFPWATEYDINASQPVLTGPDSFIISAGYGHGAALVRITKSGDAFSANAVWQNTRMKNKFTSSVLHEGHLYGLDEAILACIDVSTGDLKWKGGRYGYGQLLLASGHLIVATEDGDVALVRATPEKHDELARFSAVEGKTWNHPAIAGGVLLVRNATEMSAFRIH
jgi:outer membrane protein assembly factor BamB